MKRVLIVGAGIGGLTAAITLERLGVAVEIVERAPSFRALGAGITIQPNATAVLDALGVTLPADDVWPMGKVAMLDARGRPLAANDDVSEGSPFPSYSVRRPDLHEALRAAASGSSSASASRSSASARAPARASRSSSPAARASAGTW